MFRMVEYHIQNGSWIMPLQIILFALGIIFITCAMMMGWAEVKSERK